MESKTRYRIQYVDEARFNVLMKTLKYYNMRAYKDFVFYHLPYIRNGKLIATKVGDEYEIYLKSDPVFEFVYGNLCVYFKVDDEIVTFTRIEPESFLEAGRRCQLPIYKGCPITSAKDRFMVDYYNVKDK